MFRTFTYAIATIATLPLSFIVGSGDAYARNPNEIELQSFNWTLHPSQILRVCVNGSFSDSDTVPIELVTLELRGDSGFLVLSKQLRPPARGFQCVDIPYAELVGPRFESDPIPESLTFRIDISRAIGANQTATIGANQSETVGPNSPSTTGAIMNVDQTQKSEVVFKLKLEKVRIP